MTVYYDLLQDEYQICDGSGEDPGCADSHVLDLDLADHLTYLQFPFTTNFLGCAMGREVREG